jgi:thermopsin
MTSWKTRTGLLVVVVAIAALMAIPAASTAVNAVPTSNGTLAPAALPAQAPAPGAAASSASAPSGPAAAAESHALSSLKESGVPMSHVFLPNFGAQVSTQGGVISPLYTGSPAPMGLGDFGIQRSGSTNVGTITYTRSIEGAATLNAVDPLYVTSSAPDEFTVQLNTVLTNVDVLGSTNYDYWIQNVPVYAADSGTLSFENNIWNFSSPATFMGYNAIYSGNGSVVGGGEVYITSGPTYYNVHTPFTVEVYNNASIVNDRPTVYFNYTLIESDGARISGSYDRVEFNSTGTVPPTGPAPMPVFQIDGQSVDPTGFLLNDAEIMLGGPGGGSTTTLFNIAGSMGLWLLPNGTSTYRTVPSAFDFGTDTGETSEGIAEWAPTGPNPVAMLGSGPSILYPLWGVAGAHRGAETITVNLSPTNAFVFANVGHRFNTSSAAWAPTPVSGPATYTLSPNAYSFRFLLSEYTPVTVHVASGSAATVTVSLASNPSLGDYTPLWAESNSQLAAISEPGGAGTVSNPYVLFNSPGTVSTLFGELNDYLFPVFPGIYLIDTSAYVSAYAMPQFEVTYLLSQANNIRDAQFGAPPSDDLNFELYNASHVSLVGSPDISGWFYSQLGFGDPASVYLWNSTYDLIAQNTFYVESNGITTSGGGHNTIWGNTFIPTTVPAPNPSSVLNAGATVGLNSFEGHDLIFNNAFYTPTTATLFPVNFYNGVYEPFYDKWNVPYQSASDVFVVNGWDLSGSILGLGWVGGNYWANYGTQSDPYGVLPYNDGGLIYKGGDYAPLHTEKFYRITFSEVGLPAGTTWSLTINGVTLSSTTSTIVFVEPNGTYAWVVNPVTGYTPHHHGGAVTLDGADLSITIHFS